jgi:hypothetical protein
VQFCPIWIRKSEVIINKILLLLYFFGLIILSITYIIIKYVILK